MSCPVEKHYRRFLGILTWIGFGVLILVYVLYVFGIITPLTAPQDIAAHWHEDVSTYMEATGRESGLGWLWHINKSDILCMLGIAFLATVVIYCYIVACITFFCHRDFVYTLFAFLQIVILTLAVIGIL